MPESDEESVSESEEEYSSEETSGSGEYSSSSVSGDSDASDSLKERRDSHGRASVSAKQLKNMMTNKAVLQEGEVIDPRMPAKFPRKPMVELTAGSNVWYQGHIIKESANEVKIVYTVPNPAQGRSKPRVEWLRKASARIWRGSYKPRDWRHLGHGAWEPRASRNKGNRSKRGGAGGGGGSGGGGGGARSRKQQQQKQRSRKDSRDSDSDSDGDGGETSGERPKSRSQQKGGSQQRQQSSREGPAGGGAGRKDAAAAAGVGSIGRADRAAAGGDGGAGTGGRPDSVARGVSDRRAGRQSAHASPSHQQATGRGAVDDEVMSPRPGAVSGPGGPAGGGGTDGPGNDGGGGGGKGERPPPSHARGGSSAAAAAATTATLDLGTVATGLPELPQPAQPQPPQQRQPPPPPGPQQADAGDVDEQASEHSPDDVAESPGGFLCDQASTRCSPSDEDAGDGRAAGAAGVVPDPPYDPLARWFLAHYSQLQAAGTLGLLPGGMYECGRLPPGFSVDPVTALIVVDDAARGGAAPGTQQPVGPGKGGGGGLAIQAPVGRSAAASPVPCAGVACGTGSSAPPDSMPQAGVHPQQHAPSGHRRSMDGSGPGPAGRAAAGQGSVPPDRHLTKQTSGGSSNGQGQHEPRERELREGASVSPAGGGATAGGSSKRPAAGVDAGGPSSHEATVASGHGGGAGSGHTLKKLKRAVIITDSEDDEDDPPSQPPPPPPPPQSQQQPQGGAAVQASKPESGPPPTSGGQGRAAGGSGSGAVSRGNGTGSGSNPSGATGGRQQEQAGVRATGGGANAGPSGTAAVGGTAGTASAGPSRPGGTAGGGVAADGAGSGATGAAATAAGGGAAVAAPGNGRNGAAAAVGGGATGTAAGNRSGSGSSGAAALKSGAAGAPTKDGVGPGKKELSSAPRPRAITTMDHDL